MRGQTPRFTLLVKQPVRSVDGKEDVGREGQTPIGGTNLALTRRRVYIEKANGKLRPLTHYGLYRLAWADVRRAR